MPRQVCYRCFKSLKTCYCRLINPFPTEVRFIILTHPLERRRATNSGRMAHLILSNSLWLEGATFAHDKRVNDIINAPQNSCFTLYPGPQAITLGNAEATSQLLNYSQHKEVFIFIIDGTWASSRKTIATSPNLAKLPRLCLSPSKPSTFTIRRQPAPWCLSSIEAIYQVLNHLPETKGAAFRSRLLEVFHSMVSDQIRWEHQKSTSTLQKTT